MKKLLFSILFFSILLTSGFAQKDKPLVTIGNTKVNKAEFERIYNKNNNNLYNESDVKTPKQYLNLFIDFKLKVVEAQSLKMDTNSVFINELAGYRKELAAPYLTDVKFKQEQVVELYKRTTHEVNASHILIRLEQNSPEEDVQKALDKIIKLRNEILAGKDFGEAAAEYSEDPSARNNKGNLGYFSAFQMVVPFEDAAFSTPVGEISEPIRSSFGFHLIKVHELREHKGELHVAHIMKMFPQGATPETKEKLKAEIDEIYKNLLTGADFAEIAKTKSDDKRSAPQGGEMPWFTSGRMIKEFAEPAFALKNNGDISKPVESDFGFHIIKKLGYRPIPSFEESKTEIEEKIKRDPARSETSKKIFIENLKIEYNYLENEENLAKLKGKKIENEIEELGNELFKIENKSYSLADFRNYLEKEKIETGSYSTNYDNWVEAEITDFEDSKLEDKYPDFKYLMQEYHDGILLFNISEEKIWNYAVEDSAGLELYYQNNKGKYLWEDRFKGSIITCKNKDVHDEVDKYFGAEMSNTEILDLINTNEEKVTIKEGAWEKGNNSIVDYYVWDGPEPENFNAETTFIRGDKISPESKNLNEARGLYISDYQNFLEKNWLKELHKKYKIKVNKKLLKEVESV